MSAALRAEDVDMLDATFRPRDARLELGDPERRAGQAMGGGQLSETLIKTRAKGASTNWLRSPTPLNS
jgi:hypothetical protein